ncbi:MAG: dihydrodipicolinate synthase family protein [Actinomycetes bacterium]
MTPRSPAGVLPVFQTPFHIDGTVDFTTLESELHWVLDQGCDGVVMGMVSEVLRLSDAEVAAVAECACALAAQRSAQCIISVGAESTHVAIGRARLAETLGATAVMAIPPMSTALDDDELLTYYSGVLDAIDLPVVIQDASGYVGQPLSIDVQARLARAFPAKAVFKPEAPPIGPRVTALLESTDGEARILEGTGGLVLVDSYRRGVVGTMPGADVCWSIVALWNALQHGDEATVQAINEPLTQLISLQGELDSFLAVEKHLLVKQGIFPNALVRGPVSYRLEDRTRVHVDNLFAALRQAALHD